MFRKLIQRTTQQQNIISKHCVRTLNTNKDDDKNQVTKFYNKQPTVTKYDPKNVSKKDMEWRKQAWHEEMGAFYDALRVFYSEKSKTTMLQTLQQQIDLSPASIKAWWKSKIEEETLSMQKFVTERHQILGGELSAAHFVVYRGGAIKFEEEDHWIKADQNKKYDLPQYYDENKIIQAIDCENMELYYEGLVNFENLQNVEWLSLNGCDQIDDWGLDKISNIFSHSLIYLDLRNCKNITHRGIGALYKMPHLKILYLDDFLRNTTYEMTCLLLQEVNPLLEIKSDAVNFEWPQK